MRVARAALDRVHESACAGNLGSALRHAGRFEEAERFLEFSLSLARTGARLTEGYGSGNVLGSYVHAHWSSTPEVPARFVARCRAASGAA